MVGIKTLSLLAAAGSALAAPQWGGHHFGGNVVTENAVVYTTVMVTVTAGQEPTPTPSPEYTPPVVPQVTTTAAPEPTPQPQQPAAPASSSSSYVPSGDGGYMDILNKWRTAMGHPTFSHDSTLEGNALKTCKDSGGQLTHELNPGSMAQVLAPGDVLDEKIIVGGWLCEEPDKAGLDGICGALSQGWSYDGQTGHAEILNGDYKNAGCACDSGVCGCDFS